MAVKRHFQPHRGMMRLGARRSFMAVVANTKLRLFVVFVLMLLMGTLLSVDFRVALYITRAQEGSIGYGDEVEVTGTGDCLRVHADEFLSSAILECLPDGTRARVLPQGPAQSDGETWWDLAGHGWVAARFIRLTAPPEPDLVSYAGDRPYLAGLIAYVGDDNNVWTVRADGSGRQQITSDGRSFGGVIPVSYRALTWSSDGRYLAFERHDPTPPRPSPSTDNETLMLYDALTAQTRAVSAGPGRQFTPFAWADGRHLWILNSRADFSGCIRESFADQQVESLDVTTNEQTFVVRPRTQASFISNFGARSPDGRRVAYSEDGYCEGVGPVCSVLLSDGSSHCIDETGWSVDGWINSAEVLLFDNPYSIGASGLRPAIVFNAVTGAIRPAGDGDKQAVRSARVGPQRYTEQPLDIFVAGKPVLHVPSQEGAFVHPQAASPSAGAFVFELQPPPPDPRLLQHSVRAGLQGWVALADGSGRAWSLGVTPRELAWQPTTLPPVLLVPGCGGGATTWTDTGWLANTVPVSDLSSGAASGHLLRGTLDGLPDVPAYLLDYEGSPGSLGEVAGLIPVSIDKMRDETGAAGAMLVTDGMGGVLVQYYTSGLSRVGPFRKDVIAAFMVAPPSRGSFLANLGGVLGNVFTCPQASDLARNADGIKALSSATPAPLPYSVVAGTRLWLPFVGVTDGVIQEDDVRPWNVAYDIRMVNGTHADPPALPNTVSALCSTVLNDPCVFELRLDDVRRLFLERYQKDSFK